MCPPTFSTLFVYLSVWREQPRPCQVKSAIHGHVCVRLCSPHCVPLAVCRQFVVGCICITCRAAHTDYVLELLDVQLNLFALHRFPRIEAPLSCMAPLPLRPVRQLANPYHMPLSRPDPYILSSKRLRREPLGALPAPSSCHATLMPPRDSDGAFAAG